MDNKIIAPIGYARSGKDTFADIAVEEYGFTRFAFADKLRDCITALNPIVGDSRKYVASDGHASVALGAVRLDEVLAEYGWDHYKESAYGDEIRALLQRFGTEVGRDLINENIWVDELDKHDGKIVVTDCRFWNEHDVIRDRNGILVRIYRPGNNPVNAHVSETVIDEMVPAYHINNDGTLDQFYDKIRRMVEILL